MKKITELPSSDGQCPDEAMTDVFSSNQDWIKQEYYEHYMNTDSLIWLKGPSVSSVPNIS